MNLKSPLEVQIELTNKCNHHCIYCYNDFKHNSYSKRLDKQEINTIVNQIKKHEIFSVFLTGGEPLLEKENFYYIVDLLRKNNRDIYLNTNLSQKISKKCLNYIKRIQSVLVAFPSHIPEKFNYITYSKNYTRVIKNLEELIKNNIKIAVNTVVTKLNKNDVYKTAEFLYKNLGVKAFSATPIIPAKKEHKSLILTKDEIVSVAKELIKIEREFGTEVEMLSCIPSCIFPKYLQKYSFIGHGCDAGESSLAIKTNGGVTKCPSLKKVYGNILKDDLKNIWEKIKKDKKISSVCKDCKLEDRCANGCLSRAQALDLSVDPLIERPVTSLPKGYSKRETIKYNKSFKLKDFEFRPENEEIYLITNGGGIVFGNESLLKFMNLLKGKNFKLKDIKNSLGKKGENLITYLYNEGMLEENEV